jgi:hypothetical protein
MFIHYDQPPFSLIWVVWILISYTWFTYMFKLIFENIFHSVQQKTKPNLRSHCRQPQVPPRHHPIWKHDHQSDKAIKTFPSLPTAQTLGEHKTRSKGAARAQSCQQQRGRAGGRCKCNPDSGGAKVSGRFSCDSTTAHIPFTSPCTARRRSKFTLLHPCEVCARKS